jgi:hypothetical protein
MYFRVIGWKGVNFIHLAHDRDQRQVIVNSGSELTDFTKGREFLD